MESPAGEIEIMFEKMERKGDQLIIVAKTGVWESRIYIDKSELGKLLKVTMSRAAIGFFFKWLLTGGKGGKKPAAPAST